MSCTNTHRECASIIYDMRAKKIKNNQTNSIPRYEDMFQLCIKYTKV